MTAEIEIEVTYHEKEIKKAISFYILRVIGMRIYAILAYSALLVLIIFSLLVIGYALLVIVFIISGYILFYIYYQRPVEQYIKAYSMRKSAIYRFCSDRVCITSEDAKSECMWSVFMGAYEIPSAFLLINKNKTATIIPKISITNESDLERFRNLLCEIYPGFKVYK